MMYRTLRAAVVVMGGVVVGMGSAGRAGAQPVKRAGEGVSDAVRVERVVRGELDKAMGTLAAGPTRGVAEEIEGLFDVYLAYGSFERDAGLLTDLAAARRLALHMGDSKNAAGKGLAPFLVENPELGKTLAFLVRPEDDVPGVYAILGQIRAKHQKEIADKGGVMIAGPLAAAVSVVYDKPPAHPVLEKGGTGTGAPVVVDATRVFEFFLASDARLVVRSRNARVWVNVVDVHCDVEELRWAQQQYAGNQLVGKVYSSIVYDRAHFAYGQPKRVFKDGYTLANIKKVGGVCTEQAYFAGEVAKAIGVPSVYVTGDGADVGHAWVGYMKRTGSKMVWDFTEGRFGDYKYTQGRVVDPQTGRATSDAIAGLTEWMADATREKVWEAGARTDAAARLVQKIGAGKGVSGGAGAWPPAWPKGEVWGEAPKGVARAADVGSGLRELRGALTACAGYEPAWRQLMAWSEKGMLDAGAKKEWGDLVMKMAGRERPDFAFGVLGPMIRSAETGAEQNRLWEWAAGEFRARPDLVSAARLYQGQSWEKQGENAKAWDSYKDVITRFANDGRSVLLALGRCEELLKKTGKEGSVVGLYEDAFRRINKPDKMSPGFETASNYYLVGYRYAEVLEEAGRGADATRVRKQIGVVVGKDGAGGKDGKGG